MLLFIKNLIFTLLVPGTVAVIVPLRAFAPSDPTLSLQSAAAGAVLLVGGSIYAWCLWDFAVTGRGTPAPIDPPKTLIVRGLYKYTRNPMYVGVLFVIGGWALLFRSFNIFIYGLCVVAVFNLFVRLYEEPHLKRTFGAAYENYCARVHRWLPFL